MQAMEWVSHARGRYHCVWWLVLLVTTQQQWSTTARVAGMMLRMNVSLRHHSHCHIILGQATRY